MVRREGRRQKITGKAEFVSTSVTCSKLIIFFIYIILKRFLCFNVVTMRYDEEYKSCLRLYEV